MIKKSAVLGLMAAIMCATGAVGATGTWNLVLPDTLRVDDDVVTLGDLAAGPVPPLARDLVIRAGLMPNTVVSVSRQDVLRRLVTAGLARGVRLTGPVHSQIVYEGRDLSLPELAREVRRVIQPLVPPVLPGAPDSWFELEFPDLDIAASGEWKVAADRYEPMSPGRNLVRIRVVDKKREEVFVAVAVLHAMGEVGTVRRPIPRDQSLTEDMFIWEWRDLAEMDQALIHQRSSIQGCSAARELRPDRLLRGTDIKETPVILAGDPVELQVRRGQVCVTVRATARQDGALGQTIPVRNDLTGRLVNAQVAGPGLVKWRR